MEFNLNELPLCAVKGLVAPRYMCACVVMGGRCGTHVPCEHKMKPKQIPADVRFLSMEPLLGPVQISIWIDSLPAVVDQRPRLDWVIVGGESGPGARPMHPKWARDLRDQCEAAGVPFLFKQWGEWSPRAKICGAGEDFQTLDPQCKRWPDVIRLGEHGLDTRVIENCTDVAGQEVYVQRVGKKAAGRLLDGMLHDGYPKAAA